ncbi:suppressor of cytokine signaling 5-like [Limulus polyphemus]|uniref:Suppressor of cytokine signaling 5-like n=1 Tax=Limulus polyphemus TaxID=6850 RepID=A0ABM1BET4_LIMPO|nr:suppressor of cytokine signaling 5-like [Limulus polyphemus]
MSDNVSDQHDDSGEEREEDTQNFEIFEDPNPETKQEDNNVETSSSQLERQPSVRKKLRTLTFGRRRKGLAKDPPKNRKGSWAFRFGTCSRRPSSSDIAEPTVGCGACICTGYRRTEDHHLGAGLVFKTTPPNRRQMSPRRLALFRGGNEKVNSNSPIIDLTRFNPEKYPIDDWDERARQERAREIQEGVDPPPGYHTVHAAQVTEVKLGDLTWALQNQLNITPYPYLERLTEAAGMSKEMLARFYEMTSEGFQMRFPFPHSQVDYMHCLVPDLLEITNCSFYWGKMDRYQAEKLLENKPEGTFLLRDSAQEEYLFSVSFRRYGRSLHARIEQWNHRFSFDSHDPTVFASSTVCGLIEHYKDPSCCMFFEPMLTIPLHRTFPFALQHLCRAVTASRVTYDTINKLQLPKTLKAYLKEYHYKQRVRVHRLDLEH